MLSLRHLATTSTVLCLVAAPALAAPALAASGGTFVGRTSDQRPVSFTASGKRVRAFSFQTRLTCSNKTGFVASAKFPSLKLRGGTFSGSFRNKSGSVRTTIKGSIHGRRASGTIRRRATFSTGRKLDRRGHLICTSSTRFTANR